jgi:uncharacterized membrane protein YhaH (DUF805 family)
MRRQGKLTVTMLIVVALGILFIKFTYTLASFAFHLLWLVPVVILILWLVQTFQNRHGPPPQRPIAPEPMESDRGL